MISLVLIFILIFQLPFAVSAVYEVQPNECLSRIAYRYCRKIYGKSGFIREVQKINPKLKSDANFLLPKTLIEIPDISRCALPWPAPLSKLRPENDPEIVPQFKKETSVLSSHKDHFFFGAYTFYKVLGTSSITDSSSPLFKRIQGVSLVSKPVLGLNFGYKYPISEQTFHFINLGMHNEDYFSSKNVKINSQSNLRSSLHFGVQHQLSKGDWVEFQAGAEERTLIDQSVYNQINLTKGLNPNIKSTFGFLLHNQGVMKAHLVGFGKYLSSFQNLGLRARQGYELGGGINYQSLFSNKKSNLSIDISRVEQSTNVTFQSEWKTNLKWSVDFLPL
jgi:hypothetical protein